MIKLEINDVNELDNLPIINSYELEEYLGRKYADLFDEGKGLSSLVEDVLEYISKERDTDNICEVYLDVGAGIEVIYGYIVE